MVCALTALLLAPSGPARAETSSWVTRSDAPEVKSPPKSKTRPLAKPAKTVPPGSGKASGSMALPGAEGPSSRFGSAPSTTGQIGPSMAPATGEEAAYIALSQGQYLTALALAEKAAAGGNAQAYTIIGRIYAEGLGVAKDEVVAARWLARGAELGDAEAQFMLGVMLAEGTGIEKDMVAAAQLFEAAARTGHGLANYNLALMFLAGSGKPENPVRAAQHLTYAAEMGIASAQYDLATLYAEGHGVPHDAYQTSRWMRRAAEQGLSEAEYEYAIMVLRGHGLNVDRPKAVEYLSSAAQKGVAGAQNRLAHLLLDAAFGPPKPADAIKWRMLAREGGIVDEALDQRISRLPAAVRETGVRAAAEWRERAEIQLPR